MNWADLILRLRAVLSPRRSERELHEELAFHIDRETEQLVESGLSRDNARARAHARFGSVTVAADQCRDQRGTGLLDATIGDVHYALRTFRRTPLASATIVGTVAIGLGLVAAVFTFFNALLFNVDAVHNPHELVEVYRRHAGSKELVPFTLPQYQALRSETDVFIEPVAMVRGVGTRADNRPMTGALVSDNFFHSLGVHAALGRVLTPADSDDGGAQVIVLSHRAWTRWFASDPSVVGRLVRINGAAFEIVGVAHEGFRGLAIGAPDYWAPIEQLGHFRRAPADHLSQAEVTIVGRLAPHTSRLAAATQLSVWATAAARRAGVAQAAPAITLEARQGTVIEDIDEVILVFTPLFFSFGLVLLIGCANASNLLLARGLARQRELGIRLSIGASRGRIVRQLLIESLLLALASAACGLLISRVILSAIAYVVMATLPPEILETIEFVIPALDWRVIVFELAAAVIATALFGLLPALQSTRLDPVRTMRGEIGRDARPSRARNALIAMQVAASAVLLISAAVFMRSARATTTVEIGARITDTLAVEVATESQRHAVVRAIGEHPSIAALAGARPHALAPAREGHADAVGPDATTRRRVPVGYRYVSAEYFSVLDIPLRQGRVFTAAERQVETAVAIVSAAAARELWPNGSALGQTVHLQLGAKVWARAPDEAPLPTRPFTVIGVVDDVHAARLRDLPLATVYLPTDAFAPRTTLIVRAHGDPDVVRMQLFERLTPIDPAIADIMTLRMIARVEGYILNVAFWITAGLAALALVLTLSGLFSVLSYVVAQRTKEIGVRIALGATRRSVSRLMVVDLLRQVALGLAAGTALAVAVAITLAASPAAELVGDAIHVFDPVAYLLSLVCILCACLAAAWIPARRAAHIDPIATLRED
jgi:predicted permease